LYVAQFGECHSEGGTTLGVVKARSNLCFSCRGDHVFEDGSEIKDGDIQLILFGGLLHKKNRPPSRLRASETERYNASLRMC
jgi:hypothetical protein